MKNSIVGKLPALQVQGPKFNPQNPGKHSRYGSALWQSWQSQENPQGVSSLGWVGDFQVKDLVSRKEHSFPEEATCSHFLKHTHELKI